MDKIASSFATNTNNLINDVEEIRVQIRRFKFFGKSFSKNEGRDCVGIEKIKFKSCL